MRVWWTLVAVLVGCVGSEKPEDSPPPPDDTSDVVEPVDADSDGYDASVDCDDAHATVNPDAPELCNERDDDCDGITDEDATDQISWYTDGDGDGVGDAADSGCVPPDTGASAVDGDCDDADATVYPGADETCDGRDEDCDGETDEDAVDATLYYSDGDDDGYGDAAGSLGCAPAAGEVEATGDCDDGDPLVHPGADETDCADPTDYNCDGSVGYTDADGDGVAACEECDDGDDSTYPGAPERCDGADDDCDGSVDEGVLDTFYADADGDGFGDADASVEACAAPVGYVADATDCDDAADTTYPGAAERCDGLDHDCDGLTDESGSADAATWYADTDGDGYGDADVSTRACDAPTGYVATSTDCDDSDDSVNPGATEVCDPSNLDEDCDGASDDADSAPSGRSTWYRDGDSDTYGGTSTTSACDKPTGYVTTSTDCDDGNSSVHPGATEVCDASNLDEDCDSAADDLDSAPSGKTTWYKDSDSDTYGGTSTTSACDKPTGYVTTSTDCDDSNGSIHPAATEVCDASNVDEDCDSLADDLDSAPSGTSTWYKDSDSDTYGGTTTKAACDKPTGYVTTSTDCDDSNGSVNPSATETCDASNVDEDCDSLADDLDSAPSGTSTWYKDSDSDTYGGTSTKAACDKPTGYVTTSTDCDDANSSVHPGATEVCDASNVDEDCDSLADDLDSAPSGTSTWYKDSDSDTYGGTSTKAACDKPTGYVTTSTDCDDANSSIHPAATEVCDASDIDEDCDSLADDLDPSVTGASTWYADVDADGYGVSTSMTTACDQPSGYAELSTDCDDVDPADHPGAAETCDDGDDDDCDGEADGGCPTYAYSGDYALEGTSSDADLVIYGERSGDTFGMALATGVDLYGTGQDSLIVGSANDYDSSTYSTAYPGCAYAYDGAPPSGYDADRYNEGSLWEYTSAAYNLGTRVWAIEDVDGDGYDELGVLEAGVGYTSYLWAGEEVNSDRAVTFASIDTLSAAFMSSGGDFEGDGGRTWMAGLQNYSSNTGVAYVYSGTTHEHSMVGEATGDYAGGSVAGGMGMDVDGDGVDDMAIGAYGNDDGGSGAGAAYVVLGGMSGTISLADADLKITGDATGDYFGITVLFPGDADGDGLTDLLVAAGAADNGGSASGSVYLLTHLDPAGSTVDATAGDATARVDGTAGDTIGYLTGTTAWSQVATGDANGDGDFDVLIGTMKHDVGSVSNAGAAWLLYGPLSGSVDLGDSADYDAKFEGNGANDNCGISVGLGDLDGDGLDELLVGCSAGDYSAYSERGTVWGFDGG